MRKNWVPLHSIIVTRDDKQVDALAEYTRTGKAFAFTDDEVKEIIAGNDGNGSMSLRSPADEVADDGEALPPVEPAAGSDQTPSTAKEEPSKDTTKVAKKAAAKDTDL